MDTKAVFAKASDTQLPDTLSTTEYDRFKIMPDNRPVSRTHVQDLITSFQENPALIRLRPILVNEHMEVVDGQHRLEACRQLEIPVPYQVVPTLSIATAQLMNALQRSWRLIDFIHSYAGSGRPEYQQIERWMDTFAPAGPSVILSYAVGTVLGNKRSYRQKARLGQIDLAPKEEVEDNLSKLSDLPVDWWYYDSFAMAFLKVLRLLGDDYDHARMVKGIKEAQITRQATTLDTLRELERAYNFKRSVDIVRFF